MSRRDRLICFADFVGKTLLAVLSLLPLPNCFLRVSLPTLFAVVLNLFPALTTSAVSSAANSQVSTYPFCSCDDIFTQKWNCSPPNNLYKCTESPFTFSTNNSIELNLYLSWSNYLVTSFRLEMIVGDFSEHQNNTSETNRNKSYFFTALMSQVHVNTMKRSSEQQSELQVGKRLIVHVLSGRNNVPSLELGEKKKATQEWSLDIVLNQVRVYIERVYADNVLRKVWFVRSLSSHHYSKFVTNITSEKVSQIRTKEYKTRYFICRVKINFLRSPRHFNCDTILVLIVSFFNESVHGFNNIHNGRVKTRFQTVEFWRLWKFPVKKHKFSLHDLLVPWFVGYF